LFSLFYLYFNESHNTRNPNFWSDNLNSPQLNAWRGFAFEEVCYVHRDKLKQALGISGVQTDIMPWRSNDEEWCQIDMLIDRADRVVNVCEIKFTLAKFAITSEYDAKLRRKVQLLMEKTKIKSNPHLTMITTFGLQQNEYSGHIQKSITMDDLF